VRDLQTQRVVRNPETQAESRGRKSIAAGESHPVVHLAPSKKRETQSSRCRGRRKKTAGTEKTSRKRQCRHPSSRGVCSSRKSCEQAEKRKEKEVPI